MTLRAVLRAGLRVARSLACVSALASLPAAAQVVTPPGSAVFGIAPGANSTGATVVMTMPSGAKIPIGTLNPTAGTFIPFGFASLAPLASPALTGTPTAPTASPGTSTNQIATTNFSVSAVAAEAIIARTAEQAAQATANAAVQTAGGNASATIVTLPDSSSPSLSTILGKTLVAPLPDTVSNFFSITTTAGSPNVTLGGGTFAAADTGKLITVQGAGPNEWRLVGKIITVTDATHLVLSVSATQSMAGVSQKVIYGTDQYASLQGIFTVARALNLKSEVRPGMYLVSQGLQCLPPSIPSFYSNGFNFPPALCSLDQGATIIAGAPMQAVITYGGIASDYSQVLRSAIFGGGTIDGNFVATDDVDVPFYVVATRKDQLTKNALGAGVKWGSLSAPSNGGGALDLGVSHLRDPAYVTIAGISNANPPVVTCAWDCGVPTGRVITPIGIAGTMATYLNLKYFEVTAIDATHFSLNNADSTSWGSFTSGRYAMTMPGMHVLHPVYGVTNANPAVFNTDTHHFTNGQQVFISDVGSTTVSGIFTVAGCTSNTCQLSGLDTTSAPTYTGNGTVLTWDDPTTVSRAISYENASDSDVDNAQISGIRWGIYAGAASGYDGKVHRIHVYNYDEAGQVFAATSLGGDYTLTDVQCDGPVHFCYRFTGPRNSMFGPREDYIGGLALNNNLDSVFRLETGGSVNVFGGSAKAASPSLLLSTISGDATQYGQLGFETTGVTLAQADDIDGGSLVVTNKAVGAASILAKGTGSATMGVCDLTSGHNGILLSTIAGGVTLSATNNSCAYLATLMTLQPNQIIAQQTFVMAGYGWAQKGLQVGAGFVSLAAGELGFGKITATGTAPGAGAAKMEVVAGTNAGTCKLIAYAGTSTTPTTVLDNIGSGC